MNLTNSMGASFQMFALTAGRNVVAREANCPVGNVRGNVLEGNVQGECPTLYLERACVISARHGGATTSVLCSLLSSITSYRSARYQQT